MSWLRAQAWAIRVWWRTRQLKRSLKVLDTLDAHMSDLGWPRHARRQFWREFIKQAEVRGDVFAGMSPKGRRKGVDGARGD